MYQIIYLVSEFMCTLKTFENLSLLHIFYMNWNWNWGHNKD